jgi:hypothetical protein
METTKETMQCKAFQSGSAVRGEGVRPPKIGVNNFRLLLPTGVR